MTLRKLFVYHVDEKTEKKIARIIKKYNGQNLEVDDKGIAFDVDCNVIRICRDEINAVQFDVCDYWN